MINIINVKIICPTCRLESIFQFDLDRFNARDTKQDLHLSAHLEGNTLVIKQGCAKCWHNWLINLEL